MSLHATIDETLASSTPTLWGLTPGELHEHFWASRGVQVICQGENKPLADDAEQFLLTDPRTLAIFRMRSLVDLLSWVEPHVLFVRLGSRRETSYRETVSFDPSGEFIQFSRTYAGSETRFARLVLTRDKSIAAAWNSAPDLRSAWRDLRDCTRESRREFCSIAGAVYDRTDAESVARFVRDLIRFWRNPGSTVPRIRRARGGVWLHEGARVARSVKFVGPAWIGAGREIEGHRSVVGPAALWDDPSARPKASQLAWDEIEPTARSPKLLSRAPAHQGSIYDVVKRSFDIVFSLLVLAVTLPFYPLVMLAIWLEDGRPFFYFQSREARGGRQFRCIKFRSMRKDADQIKAQLANQADGPQFFVADDPRKTRVGIVLRKLNVDELPQFLNVLLGDMSVVGPRPSPRRENQFCPPWREARLSVRPGITGLWQVRRTRTQGLDFQEWIKFDIEYVEKLSFLLDMKIIVKTFGVLIHEALRR
jgi:lipopolysaccharide/colanic/teichoic acid biosynthesis glycosyltransferase